MTTLILAGGESTRWGNHLGVPKHLAPIYGEPLIHRLIRQLNERGVRPTVVVRKDAEPGYFKSSGADYAYTRFVRDGPVQEQESSRHLWDGLVKIIYGDLVCSEAFMDEFTGYDGPDWRVYGRAEGSSITGKEWGEMLGWVLPEEHHALIDASREYVTQGWLKGKIYRALGWEVYRHMMGFDVHEHIMEPRHFREWDDESDDIDFPKDYEDRVARGLA